MYLSPVMGSLLRPLLPVAAMLVIAGCNAASESADQTPYEQSDIRVGTGKEAINGKILGVNYTGWLHDPSRPDNKGQVFDTSVGKETFTFVLGRGDVIAGWDKGVEGMKVGGLRRLVVPASLAYGTEGAGNGVIPPNATLIFEVELLNVVN